MEEMNDLHDIEDAYRYISEVLRMRSTIETRFLTGIECEISDHLVRSWSQEKEGMRNEVL